MSTLVLIPGLACDQRMWRSQLDALGALWPTEVAHSYASCDSITGMAQATLDEFAGELVLCGASMGGMIALEAVRLAPQRVRALALLGTLAHPETPDMHQLRSDAIQQFQQGHAEDIIRANVALAFHPDHATDAALTNAYLEMVLDAGAATLIRQNRAVMARPDARTHLAHIDCPVLVMCGADDALTPAENSRAMAARIAGAKLVILERCGHMLTMEQLDAVNRHLKNWLAGLFPRSM